MDLSEDAKYRLAYLTLRVLFDDKLSRADPGSLDVSRRRTRCGRHGHITGPRVWLRLFDDLGIRLAALRESERSAGPGVLAYLDMLAGTQMAGQAGGKRYASQREKLESFIDAEFGEEMLAVVNRAVAELV